MLYYIHTSTYLAIDSIYIANRDIYNNVGMIMCICIALHVLNADLKIDLHMVNIQ